MAPLYDAYREVGGSHVIPNGIGRSAELQQGPLHTGDRVAAALGRSPEGLRKL
jgi:hypothetical protein